LIVGLALCAGCGGTAAGDKSRVANSCSDSTFVDALSPRLGVLESAVLVVDAGHGDVAALTAGGPALEVAARLARDTANKNRPCRPRLTRARGLVLVAAKDLSSAGHQLVLFKGAVRKGKDYSAFESQFLADYLSGSQEFHDALASLRGAGVRGLVSASDGKGIFKGAGCANCHTLAAAAARSTVGPNLDAAKPAKDVVIQVVTSGQGPMLSFQGVLSAAQIQAVADFVSRNAGK
jgi:cytochrome c551/c552